MGILKVGSAPSREPFGVLPPVCLRLGRRCSWVLFLLGIFLQPAQAAPKKVLLLNSYHSGYEWTDDLVRGVNAAFAGINPAIEVHIEYMDVKRNESEEFASALAEFYKKKFAAIHFDAILASDDAAVQFLLKRRDEIFPGVPIVFCGVNEYRGSSNYLTSSPENR